ncbi:MAG: hypothetical protein MI924_10615, partial [Chloroflexales bacterium]|nr:hypothetical protein [Chloroflexales bacterium]
AKGRKGAKESVEADVNEADAEAMVSQSSEPSGRTHASNPPKDATEAERRFYARYGEIVGGSDWKAVQRYLGSLRPRPSTVEDWIAVAEEVRSRSRDGSSVIAA